MTEKWKVRWRESGQTQRYTHSTYFKVVATNHVHDMKYIIIRLFCRLIQLECIVSVVSLLKDVISEITICITIGLGNGLLNCRSCVKLLGHEMNNILNCD